MCHGLFAVLSVDISLSLSSPPPPQLNNPDMRVVIIKEFVKEKFPSTPLLDYALEVEKITTSKVLSLSLSLPPKLRNLCHFSLYSLTYRNQISFSMLMELLLYHLLTS